LPGDFRHIAVSSSTDGGKTFARPVIVSDDQWVLKGCPVSGAALSAEADGSLRVLWYAAGEKGQHGIYWSESQDGGQTFTPRELLAASSALGTPVLLHDGDGRAMGVWETYENGATHLVAARFGTQAGNNVIANTTGELPAAAATTDQLFIADIVKDGDRQTIWLVTAHK
jgi:hypothetical protein